MSKEVGSKRVLLVIHSLASGGAERQISQLADELVDKGIEVHLVTWGNSVKPDFYILDQRVYRHKLNRGAHTLSLFQRLMSGISVIFAIRQLIKTIEPDCVLSFIDISNVLTLIAASGYPTRVVVSERIDPRVNDTIGLGWRMLRIVTYQRANLIVAQTSAVADWMALRWHVYTAVIPNFLRKLPEPATNRDLCLISVGRIVPQKGFDLSIRAFADIIERHPGWHYVILGEGPNRDELLELCAQLGVSGRVSFLGVIDDVGFWLSRASIAVQPSRFEGFPNAVMEAMAMGLATISCDCPSGPSDLIEHMQNGVLVPVNDQDALATEMDRFMSDPALRHSIGTSATAIRETLSSPRILALWNAALFCDDPSS